MKIILTYAEELKEIKRLRKKNTLIGRLADRIYTCLLTLSWMTQLNKELNPEIDISKGMEESENELSILWKIYKDENAYPFFIKGLIEETIKEFNDELKNKK